MVFNRRLFIAGGIGSVVGGVGNVLAQAGQPSPEELAAFAENESRLFDAIHQVVIAEPVSEYVHAAAPRSRFLKKVGSRTAISAYIAIHGGCFDLAKKYRNAQNTDPDKVPVIPEKEYDTLAWQIIDVNHRLARRASNIDYLDSSVREATEVWAKARTIEFQSLIKAGRSFKVPHPATDGQKRTHIGSLYRERLFPSGVREYVNYIDATNQLASNIGRACINTVGVLDGLEITRREVERLDRISAELRQNTVRQYYGQDYSQVKLEMQQEALHGR